MEHADYHIIYVDNRVSRELDGKLLQYSSQKRSQDVGFRKGPSFGDRKSECLESILGEIEEVRCNLQSLLSIFNGGMSCHGHCPQPLLVTHRSFDFACPEANRL